MKSRFSWASSVRERTLRSFKQVLKYPSMHCFFGSLNFQRNHFIFSKYISLSTMFVEKFKTSNERFPKLNMNYMTTNRIHWLNINVHFQSRSQGKKENGLANLRLKKKKSTSRCRKMEFHFLFPEQKHYGFPLLINNLKFLLIKL